MDLVAEGFASVGCLAWIGRSDGHSADELLGELFMFFSILECGVGAPVWVGARAGILRDEWKTTVVNP